MGRASAPKQNPAYSPPSTHMPNMVTTPEAADKEIGGSLLISERTVESHVRNILNKLGFNSRSQIASWVGSSRLPV